MKEHLTPQVQLGLGLIGVSLAVGVGVLLFSGSAKGATSAAGAGRMAITLEPGGQIYENVPLSGVTISLPANAVWVDGPTPAQGQGLFAGTSKAFALGPFTSGQQVKTTLTWKDASGNVQTTDLTLSAGV